jgi:hypothetical protein
MTYPVASRSMSQAVAVLVVWSGVSVEVVARGVLARTWVRVVGFRL